ncbi:SusC/RagA family TonB-linked outer membrane protein [Sphingobacterium alkalisoli]|uniref:SusC/RagA family TonB-linked outer membrane protein n=1 Tax=Sphingobacterium alkalisoli TaxID=1874115 RepID=A0A4U0GUC7_9SPHI|nr:SusC/RagA family TonB-linked outer membrane protein [Sphingobacterium alkalisoli]TJY62603.1 SusC/RagA family TonB-linked outer membrane protein [Sphingobacterium alkalisoli]GGH27728.1 SusC/RagA family TonB-linked outer membrane protein [Sphingobacterium alkalisoli]
MKINLNQPAHQGVDFHARYADFPREKPYSSGKHNENIHTMGTLTKTWMKLNLIVLLLLIGISQVDARSYAQQITLKRKNSSLEIILKEIEKQSGYVFFYKEAEVSPVRNISVDVKNMPLRQAINSITDRAGFTYDIFEKTIVLKKMVTPLIPRTVTTPSIREEVLLQQYIRGKVVDETGKPIAGASIRLKSDAKKSVVSQANGEFSLPLSANEEVIVVSFVGFTTKEVIADLEKQPLVIKLTAKDLAVDEVVVTGTGINRNKDSFTGTTTTFSGDELKSISNNNIIQSLRTLDPSFLQLENNLAGSNPNVMPVIEVRGKSSIPSSTLRDEFGSDPNQPLFVLDGFPTTLQTIVDLDMNRVASVTILKDAASTALYGSQASNGVVVIETIKPKPGELRFTYTQDFRFEAPDLTAYNMMNASEKLEFERLAGRYLGDPSTPNNVVFLDSLYHRHLSNVQRGIDSYWLSEPIQYGYSTNNSINASGGDEAFTYNLGLNYRIGEGAMIGSGRDSYSGSISLTYRKDKLNINNITYIRGNMTNESPYGSFSTFVNANPYFEKTYDNPFLEVSRQTNGSALYVTNPLYDAMQPQYNKSRNIEVQNNLNANYDITTALRLNVGLQITKGNTESKQYKSPGMSDFLNTTLLRKGRYSDSRNNNFSYQGNLMLTYYKTFAAKHHITANWRNTISESKSDAYATIAEGFPEGSLGNPRFAFGYLLDGAPAASSGIYRSLNSTLTANYSYDNRYLMDVVYRLDGSTAYGSNQQYSPYYAFGLGWNLHREQFAKNIKWINSLRLTGNIGVTGNQNFANISSVSIYNYNSNTSYNQFGQGLDLQMLGNPNLEPQKTRQISTSLDFSFFNNRFTGYINAYDKRTDPLIVPVDLPSSTGVYSYPYNVGSLTYRGLETKLTFFPIYNLEKGFTWNIGLTGSTYKSHYDGFGNILNTLNKQQENNKTLVRYMDGASAEAIWAIKSMGIDPATGREVFLTTDGQYTFDYNTANIVNVGNTVAIAEGVFSTNVRYNGFTFGLGLRYRLGGDVFNTALFDKVENISFSGIANNQDKRALYDRWKNPGDIAQFKGISQTSTTPISSRFVQKTHTLSSETLNLGYLFEKSPWLQSMRLQSLSINIMANDFLYFSTVRRERGIDYPYARTFACSLRASF